jgi:uncharacterized protein (DUF433 family)
VLFRSHLRITEKEILIALSQNNKFFQKVLIDYDLKEKDVESVYNYCKIKYPDLRLKKEILK